jgi:hypothetical protein
MQEHAGTIRDLGVSDIRAIGVNPNCSCGGLQADYWALLQKRQHALCRERAAPRPGLPSRGGEPKLLKAQQIMKDRKQSDDLIRAALSHVSRRAHHDDWLHEVEFRDGLINAREAATVVGVSFEAVRHALRRGQVPSVMMKSPARSGPQRMVKLADVRVWAFGR